MTYAELVDTATEAAKRGDYAKARASYAKVLEMRPNFAPLLAAYAEACRLLGDKREAFGSLERCLELDQSKPEVALTYLRLARDLKIHVRRELVGDAGRRWLKQRLLRSLPVLLQEGGVKLTAEVDWGVQLDQHNRKTTAAVRRARALILQHQLEDAQTIIDKLPENDAVRPALLELRGRLQSRLGQNSEAAACFEDALVIEPDEPALHCELLLAWIAAGRLGLAESSLAALSPSIRRSPEVRLAEAMLQSKSGRMNDALETLEFAAELPQLAGPCLDLRVRVLSSLGRFDEAQTWIERLADIRPYSGGPFLLSAMNRRLDVGNKLFVKAEELVTNPRVSQQSRAAAAFALGRALQQAGNHELAIERIEQGNSLVDRIYDREAEERDFETLKSVFTPALVGKARDTRRGQGLVFVVGLPRSGSTLVSSILGRHPDAVSVGEFPAAWLCIAQAQKDGYPEAAPGFPEQYLESIAETYRRELPSAARDAAFVIDKELNKAVHLGLMKMIFPGAHFVHTRRDHMDVCFSIYSHLFEGAFSYAHRQDTLAHYYRLHDGLMRHWKDALGSVLYECQYERLVVDPTTEIPQLLQGAGMNFHPDCLHPEDSEHVDYTSSVSQVRKGIYKSSIGTWQRHADRLATLSGLLDGQ